MKKISIKKEIFPFKGNVYDLPYFDGEYFNVLRDKDKNILIDNINFKTRNITRYSYAPLSISQSKLSDLYNPNNKFNITGDILSNDLNRIPHTCHSIPSCRYLFVTNAYSLMRIDTVEKNVLTLPCDFDKNPILYSKSNCFSSDYQYLYFVRWPMKDMIEIRNGKMQLANCEICSLNTNTLEIKILHRFLFPEEVHQISISMNNRYLVITSFVIYFPQCNDTDITIEMRNYIREGLKQSKVATYDLQKNKIWITQLPIPAPGHFELDPIDSSLIYLSAHNLFVLPRIGVIGAGYASIIKLKIENMQTKIIGEYSDKDCLRTTQHRVFIYKGQKILVFTTTPYKFTLLNLDSMQVWRKVRIAPDPKPRPTKEGYFVFAQQFPLSIEVSEDCKYIIAASQNCFYIYSIEDDCVLDVILYLPNGRGVGHTFPVGR